MTVRSATRLAGLGLSTLSATLLLAACSGKEQAPAGPPGGAMPPLPVTALEMQPTRVETSVEAVAQTEGAREVEVRARVGGILEKRVFEEGSPVKAGQALYQIDRAPLETAVAQARADNSPATAKPITHINSGRFRRQTRAGISATASPVTNGCPTRPGRAMPSISAAIANTPTSSQSRRPMGGGSAGRGSPQIECHTAVTGSA